MDVCSETWSSTHRERRTTLSDSSLRDIVIFECSAWKSHAVSHRYSAVVVLRMTSRATCEKNGMHGGGV